MQAVDTDCVHEKNLQKDPQKKPKQKQQTKHAKFLSKQRVKIDIYIVL